MKSYLAKSRLVPLVLIFGMILLIFCGLLYNTQILNGSDYKARSLASNATAQTVEASRGIITDRNGKVLISNRLTYTLIFSAKEFDTDQELNAAILRLTDLCTENNTVWNDTLPLSKTAPYSYTDAQDSEGFALFQDMLFRIRENLFTSLTRVRLQQADEEALEGAAGMRRLAGDAEHHEHAALAAGDHVAGQPPRLAVEHHAGGPRLALDHRPAFRRADLLIPREQPDQRARRAAAGPESAGRP